MESRTCAICGKIAEITKDHIPPKGIFPKPRPSNLITVPCCFECNNSASKYDELFRVYLSLHVGLESKERDKLFKNHVLPTVRHNNKLRKKLFKEAKRKLLSTPQGIIYDEVYELPWDSDAHDKVIERTIRGLYFYHYGEALGNEVPVDAKWYKGPNQEIFDLTENWSQNSIGVNIFDYRYVRAVDSPEHSLWYFQFYCSHWAGGSTGKLKPNNALNSAAPQPGTPQSGPR